MKKCFALAKTFGLTPFGPRAPAAAAAPFGRAREGETAPFPSHSTPSASEGLSAKRLTSHGRSGAERG